MGENEWLNGYLEAILDAGSGGSKKKTKTTTSTTINLKISNDMLKLEKMIEQEEQHLLLFNPTKKYFVQGVVDSFDETHLYRTWIKVIATRKSHERPNRLENICWRIWHLTRKKKQIAWDNRQKLVKQRHEREKGRIDAAEDLSEISEGEKETVDSSVDQTGSAAAAAADYIPRINSETQIWSDDDSRKLYIVLISLHGLVRGEDMELGRDSDTGGQVKYVVELARALANTEGVRRVDLLTRQITSSDVDSTYGEPIEMLSCPSDRYGRSCGSAYIIRIPCGPCEKYIPKESLWPYIGEFVDGALGHIVNVARALGEQQEVGTSDGKPLPTWPYVIHGHYADAGEVAARLSGVLNVPMVLTGHSLGRNKLEQLLKQGRLSREGIDTTYNIVRRIEAEELALDSADMVVTSTSQEIEEQWGLYDGFDIQVERKLRVRRRRGVTCLGRCMPRMAVIPPGIDFSSVTAPADSLDVDGDLGSFIGPDRKYKRPIPPIWSEIMRFFTNPHKPMILALSRPDPKKNVTTLLEAFGECQQLRELANLTLILGNRDDIEEMSSCTSSVLTSVLKLIDKYDLYGHVAYPKHHKQPDVPEIYRLAGKTKGVFINPALVEPFGLTLIEAAAYGLPIIATRNGGPVDIVKALNNGLLVDPHDHKAVSDALLKLVADKNLWLECRKNGLKYIHRFSWPAHCRNYLSHVAQCRKYHQPTTHHLSVRQSIINPEEEPLSESLRGVEDLSLKFSVDVDIDTLIKKAADSARKQPIKTNYCPPGRKQQVYAIAVDSYESNGNPIEGLPSIIKNIKQIADSNSSHTGLVLLTSLSLVETEQVLIRCDMKSQDFDALVCRSGSEIYFPWRNNNNIMTLDEDYENHIDYRWPGEHVKSTVTRLAENDVFELVTGSDHCSSHCYSYSLKPQAKAPKIDELRQKLRMRGIRCNLVYTHASSRLNVIPLYASRAQALRYLSVIWSIELSKVTVFLGRNGDTDYQELVRGIHTSIILKYQPVESEEDNSSSMLADNQKSNKIAICEGFEAKDISNVLGSLSTS